MSVDTYASIDLLQDLLREASENIPNEMSNSVPYTLAEHYDAVLASSLTLSGVCLTFDQINDLLCAQTAGVLRDIMNDQFALPALRARLAESLDSLNRERQSRGRVKV